MALTQKCEIVVFSPARRASRKLLERMVEFVRLLGHEPIEVRGGLTLKDHPRDTDTNALSVLILPVQSRTVPRQDLRRT